MIDQPKCLECLPRRSLCSHCKKACKVAIEDKAWQDEASSLWLKEEQMAGWTTGTCEANGISVHYLRTGGNKPPVVLLHGLMTSGACWTPVARALERDYDVIMPDARGHGNSVVPDQGYRYENLAADAVSLIDVLNLANPVLVGHSMGG